MGQTNSIKLVLSRKYLPSQTVGRFIILNEDKVVHQFVSLELPWNNNQKNCSCIPEGVYIVNKIESVTRGECFHVTNVKDRTAILIHKGNYASITGKSDTLGCILPGMYADDINGDGLIDVCESGIALSKMLDVLPDTFNLYII
jgi:hypothetical protein